MIEFNVNAGFIDQQILGIIEKHPDFFANENDLNRKKSMAFVLLCMKTALDLPLDMVNDLLTEGEIFSPRNTQTPSRKYPKIFVFFWGRFSVFSW